MSAQEDRQKIIENTIPQLIKVLTNYQDNNPNLIICEQFAWDIIKNHRSLSINSHEVKRKVEGIVEKFSVSNYIEYAKIFRELCDQISNHPLCLNHYETDVHWSILDFLISVSYNPIRFIKHNKINIQQCKKLNTTLEANNRMEYWANLLKEDWILNETQQENNTSDLSDWSDTSTELLSCNILKEVDGPELLEIDKYENQINSGSLEKLQPITQFQLFTGDASQMWLFENIQNTWWDNNSFKIKTNSSYEQANSCYIWHSRVSTPSVNLNKVDDISTTAEYCLLREIIWMLQAPITCKFFSVSGDKITVRENVSLASTTANGLKLFLESFLPYITMLNTLRSFIKMIYDIDEQEFLPHTYECYATGLQQLLQPINEAICREEDTVRMQKPGQIISIIQLKNNLSKQFIYIESLYNIHSSVILNHKQNPAHICSAYLLSGLLSNMNSSGCEITVYQAASLFILSIKVFCRIIDSWWNGGRLDDWKNEFLVEKIENKTEKSLKYKICSRMYEKNKEKSFFVNSNISAIIQDDSFIKLLMDHSLEAGVTLNLLHEIDKIYELKLSGNIEDCLYTSFADAFLAEIKKYKSLQDETITLPGNNDARSSWDIDRNSNSYEMLNACDDEFLRMAFGYNLNFDDVENKDEIKMCDSIANSKMNALTLFDQLKTTSKLILPLDIVINKCMSTLLRARISFANSFVIKLYQEQFEILKHLRNIRKVFLLEASDIMHTFYTKLFMQIESGKSWANPFVLTVQLDDVLCSKFPEMAFLFRIEIASSFKCETIKVIDAVDQLIINYNVKNELKNIISEESITHYNSVFQFLLKVKWGLWSLENLRFQTAHKSRPPYAKLSMLDVLMRRLEQLRFWMIYALQCVHFHLMTHVLQSMGDQLDEKMKKCSNLTEMLSVHESYINTVCEHCFLKKSSYDIKIGVEQLLNLIYVLRFEWNSCVNDIEGDGNYTEIGNELKHNYAITTQIEAIENTYIRCHKHLVNILTDEVYTNQNSYLSGLSAAFSNSVPY